MTRPPFDRWFDRFLDSWLAWHPITATLLGATDFDHTLPDYSRDANADRIARARALIAELDALPWQDHTEAQQYDRILARGALELLIWETNAPFFQTGNPVQHTTEAIVSVASLFWNETVPLGDRVEAAVARMRQIPAFLETARQVRAAPLPWTELAIRQANAGAEFFGIGLAQLAEERGIERPAFLEQAAIAAEAVAEHASWLGSVLAERRIGIHTVGAGAIDRYLHLGHVLPAAQTAEWWFTYAHEELVEATTELRELTRAIDWRNAPRALLRQLPAIHPTPETYASTFPAVWNWAREIAERAELLTWPDGPVAFKPIPAYERGIREVIDLPVYYGADPLASDGEGVCVYPALDPTLPEDARERVLRSMNDSRILLETIVRSAGLGRHVQQAYARTAPTRIGRLAATPVPTRPAFFCGNAVVDGWACYAAELMEEVGALTPLQRLSEADRRLGIAARAVADVGFHTGELTFGRIGRMFRDEAGLTSTQAMTETVRISMFPGMGMAELAGAAGIDELRLAIEERDGDAFSLRSFHDRFLGHGAIPVTLIAASMLQ